MRTAKRVMWFVLGVLTFIGVARVFAAGPEIWTMTFGNTFQRRETELKIFCDGPHRVYVLLPDTAQQSPSIFVERFGCINWPKQPAEATK